MAYSGMEGPPPDKIEAKKREKRRKNSKGH